MEKEWYKSKTILAGVVIVAYGVLAHFGIDLPTELVLSIASGLGLVGIRDAISKN